MATSNDAVMEAGGEVQVAQMAADLIGKVSAPGYLDRTPYKPTGRKIKAPPPPEFKSLPVIDLKAHGGHKTMRRLHLDLCHGNHDAADLYLSVLSPFVSTVKGKPRVQNVRDGVFYWGCPLEKWAERHDWSHRHTKYLFMLLRDWGLVSTRAAKTPYNMLQVRPMVAGGAAHIPGIPDESNYGFVKSEPEAESLTGRASQTENCLLAEGQNLSFSQRTEIVGLKNKPLYPVGKGREVRGLEPVPENPGTTEHTPLVSQGEPNPNSEKPANLKTSPGKNSPHLTNGKRRSKVVTAWERLTGQPLEADETDVPKAAKQLKDAMLAMYEAKVDWLPVMEFGIARWNGTHWHIDPKNLESESLDRPRARYFLKHWRTIHKMMLAVQGAKSAPQQAPAPQVIPAPTQTPAKAPSASNDKPSLDYCNATMAELDAILKSKA